MVLNKSISIYQKIKFYLCIALYIKNRLKINYSHKCKTVKLLDSKLKPHKGLDRDFLDTIPNFSP